MGKPIFIKESTSHTETYLTPKSRVILSTESYDENVQTANSDGTDGISVVQDQSFSKY